MRNTRADDRGHFCAQKCVESVHGEYQSDGGPGRRLSVDRSIDKERERCQYLLSQPDYLAIALYYPLFVFNFNFKS